MAEPKDGCVQPAAGPLITDDDGSPAAGTPDPGRKETKVLARVGYPAPDFEATAFIPETGGFQPIKLSGYKGKWITLCFYPGDFTFV